MAAHWNASDNWTCSIECEWSMSTLFGWLELDCHRFGWFRLIGEMYRWVHRESFGLAGHQRNVDLWGGLSSQMMGTYQVGCQWSLLFNDFGRIQVVDEPLNTLASSTGWIPKQVRTTICIVRVFCRFYLSHTSIQSRCYSSTNKPTRILAVLFDCCESRNHPQSPPPFEKCAMSDGFSLLSTFPLLQIFTSSFHFRLFC